MPNNKYLRSVKRERELVNYFRKNGQISGRSAGSHSPVDVFAWDEKNKTVSFIQVKTKKGTRFSITKNWRMIKNATVFVWTQSWE